MRYLVVIVCFVTGFCGASCAQDVFPMGKGTYWIYQGTARWTVINSNRVQSERLHWKMEIVDTIEASDLHAALIRGAPWDLGWYEPGRNRGDYAIISTARTTYLLHGSDARAVYRLLKSSGLTNNVQQKLADNIWFREPLRPNGRYCAPDQEQRTDKSYCWVLDHVRKEDIRGIRGVENGSYSTYVLTYRTMPEHEILNLVPGVGITRWEFQHHGTVAEASIHLIEYHQGVGVGTTPPASNR
jgi:hypothetical protein